MSVARTWAVSLTGVQGRMVEVEADLAQGLPAFTIVGLPDTSVSEARDRVRAAVVNSRLAWPQRRLTVGLSPASVPKRGSAFDLAVAAAVLGAAGEVPLAALGDLVLVGELGLDGRARPVQGVLPCVLAAAAAGAEHVVVAQADAAEAALVPGVSVWPIRTLSHLVAVLRGDAEPAEVPLDEVVPAAEVAEPPDLVDVVGQEEGRRALEVAAAGGHHLLMHGPPGAGKTMLAERLPGLLPDLDPDAALEVASVRSVAGSASDSEAAAVLVHRPPFVAPHHTASVAAVIGGGSRFPRPGAVSLAHRGVLFMDEAPEFDRRALEALREPLESGVVSVSRSEFRTTFPARVQLVLAANPCPCGAADAGDASCSCTPHARRRYAAKLSGPLLDRVDVVVKVDAPDPLLASGDGPALAALLSDSAGEPTAAVAERVRSARERAARRWSGERWRCNAEVPGSVIRASVPPGPSDVLHDAVREGRLSARGADKVLRVAWTIADLRGADHPARADMGESLALRLDGAWDGSVPRAGAGGLR